MTDMTLFMMIAGVITFLMRGMITFMIMGVEPTLIYV
jgi:hypothetical protein